MTPRMHRWLPSIVAGTALVVAVPVFVHESYSPVARAETSPVALQAAGMPSLAPLIEKVTPAVVNISVKEKGEAAQVNMQQIPEEFRRFFPGMQGGNGDEDNDDNGNNGDNGNAPREMPGRTAMGSGVIVDAKNGYIMTNFHVVDHAKEITVTLKDRREFTAKVLGSDKGTDIALLKIDADNLSALPIGDSSALKVGDYVIAVGNPFGLGQTVTSGIVSALGRSGLSIEGYEDFIQTDASINPGNSGGALVNMKGELVGINTAIIGPTGGNVGIGFAVPTNMANSVMTQLVKYGEVKRGVIGVQVQDMTPELAKSLGVKQMLGAVVERVEQNSPAEHAGLKTGDVVVGVDNKPVVSSSDLHNRVGLMPIGTTLHIDIVRDGSEKNVAVTVEKEAKVQTVAAVTERPTLEGAKFTGDGDVASSKASARSGIEVTEVERDSPAWQIGLRPKDRVVAVNRTPVNSIGEMNDALKAHRQAALFIRRAGQDVLLIV